MIREMVMKINVEFFLDIDFIKVEEIIWFIGSIKLFLSESYRRDYFLNLASMLSSKFRDSLYILRILENWKRYFFFLLYVVNL